MPVDHNNAILDGNSYELTITMDEKKNTIRWHDGDIISNAIAEEMMKLK